MMYLFERVLSRHANVSQLRSGFDEGSSEVATAIMANEDLRTLLEAMQTVTNYFYD